MVRAGRIAALALLVAACAAPTSTYVARNSLRVAPLTDGSIEVFAQPGTVARDYFCAAGDYAQRRLGASNTTYVVMTGPDGPSRSRDSGRSAVFGLSATRPPAEVPRGTSLRMSVAGESLSVAQARALCRRDCGFSITGSSVSLCF